MELLPYELFASVARTQNLTRTAEEYRISQPAVSHHIKALEASLGVELVKRTKRGVTLTPEGQAYLPYVQEMLDINDRASARMRGMAAGAVKLLRIAALSSASLLVSDCLVELYSMHPDIHADINLLDGAELTEAMRRGSCDFYFAVAPMSAESLGCESRVINESEMALFVNRRIASTIDINDWSTVKRHPFVSVPRSDVSLYGKVMAICRSRGFEPNIINVYNRAESVVLSVNAGLGVAILPEALGLLYQRPNVVSFPISGEEARASTVFVWNPDRLTRTGEIFRDVVLSMYPQQGE